MCRSVCQSVGRSVPRLIFWHIASGFFITAPAQSHANDAIVYTGLSTAPALHITAPAQHPLPALLKKNKYPRVQQMRPRAHFQTFGFFDFFDLSDFSTFSTFENS